MGFSHFAHHRLVADPQHNLVRFEIGGLGHGHGVGLDAMVMLGFAHTLPELAALISMRLMKQRESRWVIATIYIAIILYYSGARDNFY